MDNFEAKIVVSEIKGLLRTLERDVKNAEFQLAFDNLNELPKELEQIRKLIDVIEGKVILNCGTQTDTDELY